MKTGLLAFLVLVWIVGALLGATYEKYDGPDWPTSESGPEKTTMDYMTDWKNITHQQDIGPFSMPTPNIEYFKTWGKVLTLQFDFLTGDYWLVYYIVFMPLAAAAILTIIAAFLELAQGFIPFT
jgi:hypothetical protein